MAVAAYNRDFSAKQDAVARLGEDKAGQKHKASKEFNESPFMKRVREVNEITKKKCEDRDKTRTETDPSFQPSPEDFKAPKAFKYDRLMNYYLTLGVTEYETQEVIKKAYRDLSLVYHPDKQSGLSQDEKDEYQAIFIQINSAYKTLVDNPTRRQYDADRDKEIAMAQQTGNRMVKRENQFDAREAVRQASMRRTAGGKAKSKLVEVDVQCRLEKFISGGSKTVTREIQVEDPESADLGILEFEAQEKEFTLNVPPGAQEPVVMFFAQQGDQHEDAHPDTLIFKVTSKPHEVVERIDASSLRVKNTVPGVGLSAHGSFGALPSKVATTSACADPCIAAETSSICGRHVLVWGSNPFYCGDQRPSFGKMQLRLWGEGIAAGGHLAFTVTLGDPAARTPAATSSSSSSPLERRSARLAAAPLECAVNLSAMGKRAWLATEPPCTIAAYANAECSQPDRAPPYSIFAIVITSAACLSRKVADQWLTLKQRLVPMLQLTGFGLVPAARTTRPRPLAASPAFEGLAQASHREVPVPWLRLGSDAFARGYFWIAARVYTQALDSDQDNATLWLNRAACLARLGDQAAALADARQALDKRPGSVKAWLRVADAAEKLARRQASEERCEDAGQSEEARLAADALEAEEARLAEGRLKEAEEALCEVVRLEKSLASVELLCAFVKRQTLPNLDAARKAKAEGNVSLHAKGLAFALVSYTIAAARLDIQTREHRKPLSVIYANRSSVFALLKQFSAAAADAQIAVEIHPQSSKAHCRWGVALVGIGEHEQAYVEFTRALELDQDSAAAKKGRDRCLTLLLRACSQRSKGRLAQRLIDIERRQGTTRVFAISDIHVDASWRNEAWLHSIDGSKFKEDVIIVAGDVSAGLDYLKKALWILRSKFRRVFYTFGRFEMHVMSRETDVTPDSIAKLHEIFKACDDLGVDVCPAAVCQGVYIYPLHSWYNAQFDVRDPRPDPSYSVDICRWPLDADEQLWKYFLAMNEEFISGKHSLPRESGDVVITFSHFLPRRELPFHDLEDTRAAKVHGCMEIDTQLRAAGSGLHVFGRSHWRWTQCFDGVNYVNQPVGYPTERIFNHQDEENVMFLQVFDGQNLCATPWNVQSDVAGQYRYAAGDF